MQMTLNDNPNEVVSVEISTLTIQLNITSPNGQAKQILTIPKSADFVFQGATVDIYDNAGLLTTNETRHNLYKLKLWNVSTRKSYQNDPFDVRALNRGTQLGLWKGMRFERGTELEFTVQHENVGTTLTSQPASGNPHTVVITLLGYDIEAGADNV